MRQNANTNETKDECDENNKLTNASNSSKQIGNVLIKSACHSLYRLLYVYIVLGRKN